MHSRFSIRELTRLVKNNFDQVTKLFNNQIEATDILKNISENAEFNEFLEFLNALELKKFNSQTWGIYANLGNSREIQKFIAEKASIEDFIKLATDFNLLTTYLLKSNIILDFVVQKITVSDFIKIAALKLVNENDPIGELLANLESIQNLIAQKANVAEYIQIIKVNFKFAMILISVPSVINAIASKIKPDELIEIFNLSIALGEKLANLEGMKKTVSLSINEFCNPEKLIELLQKNPKVAQYIISYSQDLKEIIITQELPRQFPQLFKFFEPDDESLQKKYGLLSSEEYHPYVLTFIGRVFLILKKIKIPFELDDSFFNEIGKLYIDSLNEIEVMPSIRVFNIFYLIFDPTRYNESAQYKKSMNANLDFFCSNLEKNSREKVMKLFNSIEKISFHCDVFYCVINLFARKKEINIQNNGEIGDAIKKINLLNQVLIEKETAIVLNKLKL